MKNLVIVGVVAVLTSSTLVLAQEEKKVPKDSQLVSLPGCAKGRTFIVAAFSENRTSGVDVEPGTRFRLSGSKEVLEGIKRREGTMVEVTGLVRKSQLNGPGGVKIAGGRVRIGGAVPQSPINDPARDPAYNQAVMDVQSYRVLPESCPSR